ncbi:hypothetical protein Hanom_Chr13g01210421 [Helianthus anomalus]
MADVRRVLDLQENGDDPIIIPERLSKGFWFRMDTRDMLMINTLSLDSKGAYDETSDCIMNIITCLVLNRPYNISQVLFNHMVNNIRGEKYIMYPRFIQMLLDDQVSNLPKDPTDEMKLHHMNSETLNRLNKYKGLTPE